MLVTLLVTLLLIIAICVTALIVLLTIGCIFFAVVIMLDAWRMR